MKPQTLEVMAALSEAEIRNCIKYVLDDVSSDSPDLRNAAANCRNIADIAEALENLLLTAADEDDRIELAAAESFENIQFVSHEEHAKIHSQKEAMTE